jgi:hypothetical protein
MKRTTQAIPFYKSKDVYIASTLQALGGRMDSTEWVNGECYFIFENEAFCLEIQKKYYTHDLKVDPSLLFSAFKDIKSIIFNR